MNIGNFGNIASQMFPANPMANMVAQGLQTAMAGGNPLTSLLNSFSNIGQQAGFNPAQSFGGGRLPMLPQMGGGLGARPFGGFGGGSSTQNAVGRGLSDMRNVRTKMESLMANKNMDPETKKMEMFKLQQEQQSLSELFQMMTNMSKKQHQDAMTAVRNLA